MRDYLKMSNCGELSLLLELEEENGRWCYLELNMLVIEAAGACSASAAVVRTSGATLQAP